MMQFARLRIVIGAHRRAAALVELESGLAIRGGLAGFALESHAGGVDLHHAPVRRAFHRHVHVDFDVAVGVQRLGVGVELRFRALDQVELGWPSL